MKNFTRVIRSGRAFTTGWRFTLTKRPNEGLNWPRYLERTTMPDVFTRAKRSNVMSRIRGHGNKETELALIKLFRQHGITGWRRHRPIFGKPDFVFPKQKVAVFVDGCFWHACPKHYKMPANNRAFWEKKFATNKARDRLVTRHLRNSGWCVIRIWEHRLQRHHQKAVSARIKARLAKNKIMSNVQ